jgi:hypothetical protein
MKNLVKALFNEFHVGKVFPCRHPVEKNGWVAQFNDGRTDPANSFWIYRSATKQFNRLILFSSRKGAENDTANEKILDLTVNNDGEIYSETSLSGRMAFSYSFPSVLAILARLHQIGQNQREMPWTITVTQNKLKKK